MYLPHLQFVETKAEKDITNKHILTKGLRVLTDIKVCNWKVNLRNILEI